MAQHSSVPNGGQKYASAKKRGVSGRELAELRAAIGNRRHGVSEMLDTPAELKARIETANRRTSRVRATRTFRH